MLGNVLPFFFDNNKIHFFSFQILFFEMSIQYTFMHSSMFCTYYILKYVGQINDWPSHTGNRLHHCVMTGDETKLKAKLSE